jgi:hypothetical protein
MTCRSLALCAVVVLNPAAHAGIQSLLGDIQTASPPPFSVQENAVQNDQYAAVFPEKQGLLLPSPLSVDISSSGVFNEAADLTPFVLPAGTRVNSYFVIADATDGRSFTGAIAFDEPILGVVIGEATLQASHPVTGLLGIVTYPANGSADANQAPAKFGGYGNAYTVNLFTRTVQFSSNIDYSGDETYNHFRVITAATVVPEPSALMVLFGGCLAAGVRRR